MTLFGTVRVPSLFAPVPPVEVVVTAAPEDVPVGLGRVVVVLVVVVTSVVVGTVGRVDVGKEGTVVVGSDGTVVVGSEGITVVTGTEGTIVLTTVVGIGSEIESAGRAAAGAP